MEQISFNDPVRRIGALELGALELGAATTATGDGALEAAAAQAVMRPTAIGGCTLATSLCVHNDDSVLEAACSYVAGPTDRAAGGTGCTMLTSCRVVEDVASQDA